jgi:hypothetical protein
MQMTEEDLKTLQAAKRILEHPGLAAKITNMLGKPIEKGMELLPEQWSTVVNQVTRKAIEAALDGALVTLAKSPRPRSRNYWHKMAVLATGAGGGAFGLPALAVELPVSTTIMLRSIADIARSEHEDLRSPAAKLACLEVFALGGRSTKDEASESGYFALRAVLAKAVSEAAGFIAEKGLVKEGAPVIVRLITQIVDRFGVAVSAKVAAQAVPAVGALGGAAINWLFINHFQDMAKGHFSVRRLERAYSPEIVLAEYMKI